MEHLRRLLFKLSNEDRGAPKERVLERLEVYLYISEREVASNDRPSI